MLEKKRIKLNDIYTAYDELIADPQDGTYDYKKEKRKTKLSSQTQKNDRQSKKRN